MRKSLMIGAMVLAASVVFAVPASAASTTGNCVAIFLSDAASSGNKSALGRYISSSLAQTGLAGETISTAASTNCGD